MLEKGLVVTPRRGVCATLLNDIEAQVMGNPSESTGAGNPTVPTGRQGRRRETADRAFGTITDPTSALLPDPQSMASTLPEWPSAREEAG